MAMPELPPMAGPSSAPPKPPPPPIRGPARTGPAGGQLVLYFDGERHEVNKDQFVIGRGKKATDLTIKDPNVSRTHAMVERVEGQFFIVDMGSTNGIIHNGQRVQRLVISPGDVFRIVKYDLRFEYE
jgi:pSer/pThr/pTyr-binding forkhead associated (FHA) protein